MTDESKAIPLQNYDFSKWQNKAKKLETPRSGSTLHKEEFDSSGLFEETRKGLESSDSKIIILAGAPRMGKSSLAKSVWDKDKYSWITMDSGDELDDLDGSEIHIIEEIQNPEEVAKFLKDTTAKKTLLTVGFRDLDKTIEELQKMRLNCDIVILEPLTVDEMSKYISRILKIAESDDLAKTIATMSGGCPFVANVIIEQFIVHAQTDPKNLTNLKWLTSIKDILESQIIDWDEIRNFNDGAFNQYIPNPAVRDFYNS